MHPMLKDAVHFRSVEHFAQNRSADAWACLHLAVIKLVAERENLVMVHVLRVLHKCFPAKDASTVIYGKTTVINWLDGCKIHSGPVQGNAGICIAIADHGRLCS